MKQSEIIAAVTGADIAWVEVAPSVEVMALPLKLNGAFVAVSARTAQACADALTRDGWRGGGAHGLAVMARRTADSGADSDNWSAPLPLRLTPNAAKSAVKSKGVPRVRGFFTSGG